MRPSLGRGVKIKGARVARSSTACDSHVCVIRPVHFFPSASPILRFSPFWLLLRKEKKKEKNITAKAQGGKAERIPTELDWLRHVIKTINTQNPPNPQRMRFVIGCRFIALTN